VAGGCHAVWGVRGGMILCLVFCFRSFCRQTDCCGEVQMGVECCVVEIWTGLCCYVLYEFA